MVKYVSYALLLGLFLSGVCVCNCVAGVFYPKKVFSFQWINKVSPLSISIVPYGINSSKKTFDIYTSIDKQYKILRITKISYNWENNMGDFLKENEYHEFTRSNNKSPTNEWQFCVLYFLSFKPKKLFNGKEIGDKFKFYLTVVYSFDDEPEDTLFLEYDVEVKKGEYQSIFEGL